MLSIEKKIVIKFYRGFCIKISCAIYNEASIYGMQFNWQNFGHVHCESVGFLRIFGKLCIHFVDT